MEILKQLYGYDGFRVALWFSLICLMFAVSAVLLQPVVAPLILSFALYALFEPLNIVLLRKGISPTLSAVCIVLLIVSIIYTFVSILIPLLIQQVQLLLERLPVILAAAQQVSNRFLSEMAIPFDISLLFSQLATYFQQHVQVLFVHGSNAFLQFIAAIVLIPVFTFFMLKEYQSIRNALLAKLPNRSFELGWIIYRRVARKLQEYLRGILLQSLIVAIVCTLGFWGIGLEPALLLGSLAGVLNVVPYLGPVFAMVLPSLIVLSQVPFDSLAFLAAIGVVVLAQLIDNFLVIPLVIANAVNLHPLFVIIGLIVFGSYFGLMGMLLAIPVLATAKIVLNGLHKGLQTG